MYGSTAMWERTMGSVLARVPGMMLALAVWCCAPAAHATGQPRVDAFQVCHLSRNDLGRTDVGTFISRAQATRDLANLGAIIRDNSSVYSVAEVRIPEGNREFDPLTVFDSSDKRLLHVPDSRNPEDEAAAYREFAAEFRSAWLPPADRLTD